MGKFRDRMDEELVAKTVTGKSRGASLHPPVCLLRPLPLTLRCLRTTVLIPYRQLCAAPAGLAP
jgi:hypothetical protein